MREIPVIVEVWGRVTIDVTRKEMRDLHVHVVAILIGIVSCVSVLKCLLIVRGGVLCEKCGLRTDRMVSSSRGRWR